MRKTNQITQVVAYYPPHLGGMENAAKIISTLLANRGHSVLVLTSNVGVSKRTKQEKNPRVNYLNSIEIAHTPIMLGLFSELLKLPKKSVIHLHISQAYAPELVYLTNKLKGVPYIAHFHLDVDASGKLGWLLKPYKKYLLTRVLRSAKRVICLSDEQKRQVGKLYKIPLSRIVVIPNGVGKEFFVKNKKFSNKTTRLLFVGRIVSQKNVSMLINALAYIKNQVQLDIVGTGEEERRVKALIKEKKLKNVTLYGKKTSTELIKFYKNADIFVSSSKKEGVSLSMLEAMAAGLPIVVAKLPGIEVIKNGGIIETKPTLQAFAKGIDDLISNKNKLIKMSDQARKEAREYSWEKTVSKIEKVYEEVAL